MAQVFESLKLDFSFRPKFAEGPRETLVFGGPRSLGPRPFSWDRPFDGPWGLVKTSVSRRRFANFGRKRGSKFNPKTSVSRGPLQIRPPCLQGKGRVRVLAIM